MEACKQMRFVAENRNELEKQSHDPALIPWSFKPGQLHGKEWSLEASFRYCRNLAKSHYENFPVIFSLLKKDQQDALATVYAYARIADDFADEEVFYGVRERLLNDWENQLWHCYAGQATHPVFIALHEIISRYSLPAQPFLDLLSAFREDCHKKRWDTFHELTDYCRRSANPVGRIVLKIFKIDSPEFTDWSDNICTALQLTNFWQDISVDLRKGRIYLPLEDLTEFRVNVGTLFSGEVPSSFGNLVRFEVERTEKMFHEGRHLVVNAGFPWTAYFATVWTGGKTVLKMVEDKGRSILYNRPNLNKRYVAAIWLNTARQRLYSSIQ